MMQRSLAGNNAVIRAEHHPQLVHRKRPSASAVWPVFPSDDLLSGAWTGKKREHRRRSLTLQ